jgi:hypothetical protein
VGGAKGAQEACCAPPKAAEQAELLKNEGPGKEGKEKQNDQDSPRDPAGLLDQVTELARVKTNSQQRKNCSLPKNCGAREEAARSN